MSKTVQKFTETGARVQAYPKGKYEVWQPEGADPTSALIDLAQKVSRGRPAAYEDSAEGLEEFAQKTAEFFQSVQRHNESIGEGDAALIPDIESWAAYLSISRKTLLMYSRRNSQWSEYIEMIKTAIYSVKKDLAQRFKIPPVVMIFDMKNNAGYQDSLHIDTEVFEEQQARSTPEEIMKRHSDAVRPSPPDLSEFD